MWIAVCLVVFLNGEIEQDYGISRSEEGCKKQIADLVERINSNKTVVAYEARCIQHTDLLRPGKPS